MTRHLVCLFALVTAVGCVAGTSDEPQRSAQSGEGSAIRDSKGFCVDVSGWGSSDGTKIQLWDCHGGDNQRWSYEGGALVGYGGKCLDVQWGNTANGTPVQLWTCNGTDAQKWHFDGGRLVGKGGKCLDVPAFHHANGQALEIWDCNGGENQLFSFDGATVTPTPPASDPPPPASDPSHAPTGDLPGWKLVYTDDFDDYRWSDWEYPQGFQYEACWVGGNTSVHDGIMDILGERKEGDAEMVTGWAQLTKNAAAVQKYGKYEVRMRADALENNAVAPLLWPAGPDIVWPRDGELDFAEDYTGGRKLSAFSHFDDGGHQFTSHSSPSGISGADWHTWGVEWTATSVKYTLDGTVWAEETDPRAIPSVPMYLGFVMACHSACPVGAAHWEIDWIAIYRPAP
jgi:hypothetical protein